MPTVVIATLRWYATDTFSWSTGTRIAVGTLAAGIQSAAMSNQQNPSNRP